MEKKLKFIKKLGARINENGKRRYYDLFYCGYCNKYVEKMNSGSNKKCCSCGCIGNSHKRTHGDSRKRIYGVWYMMLNRCYNKKSDSFKWYGGKGISVFKDWHKYENFREWAYDNGYSDNLEIDRKDNNKDYTPDNCRFVTKTINIQNSGVSKLDFKKAESIRNMYKSGKHTRKELSEHFSVSKTCIDNVIRLKSWIPGL